MIHSIIATNHFNQSLTIELASPEKSGLAVLSVDGLGPVKATINMDSAGSQDGTKFRNARATNRNITIQLRYMNDIEESRLKTYKYFPVKEKVKITIVSDDKTVFTYGWVESNEPDIFSPETEGSISIVCEDSYFQSQIASDTVFYGIHDLFEFPFSNESLTEPLITISSIETNLIKPINYKGDIQTGFEMIMTATGSVSGVRMYDLETREIMAIDDAQLIALTGSGIIKGDQISIQTRKGYRSATLYRDGSAINILNTLGKGTDWFVLERGDNLFAYTATDGLVNTEFKIVHRVLYEGI